MYRMQVFGPALTGMHWHRHKGSAHHFSKYKELGKKMPVTVTLGGDPAYTYAATAPLPENVDENMLSGFLRKKKSTLSGALQTTLKFLRMLTLSSRAYVDPEEEFHPGRPLWRSYRFLFPWRISIPCFHVTCITHRKNAIYPATIVGIPPMEDSWLGKATERLFLFPRETCSRSRDKRHQYACSRGFP